jgi:hypothetical protein
VPPPRKPSYRTFVVERHVPAPRERVWQALTGLLESGEAGPAGAGVAPEFVLSFEPPWRRAARLDVAGAELVEHTVALRDDGASCHLVWAYVARPLDDVATAGFDQALRELEYALPQSCDRVAAVAAAELSG